ncbi:hypothetical protein GCM10008957_23050 [Deinococcus ruber]|uniref:Uncharacterized protein n=2 Tax=Deinococcus ruber TaxID=1848197 RepID=A0A918C7H8_9DEIO|nr:hypothetical protein GCM10008957_23050 [Deinococcus ruber]
MTIVGAVETGALERPVATDELRAEGEVSTELLTGDDVMRETEGLLTRCRDLERQLEPVLKDAAERARLFPQVTSLYNRYCELEALDVTATIHPDDLERFLRVGTRLQELQQVLLP